MVGKRILLVAEHLDLAGGIRVSVESLVELLLKLGHEPLLLSDRAHLNDAEIASFRPDLLWTHGWTTSETQVWLERASEDVPLWVQLHDYKEFCLTGRKAIGNELTTCDRALGPACLAVHALKGCGKGRNFAKLALRLLSNQRRIALMRRAHRVWVFSERMRSVSITNGIDPSRVAISPPWLSGEAQPSTDASTDKPIDLLWVGRMVKEKGPELFLETLAELAGIRGAMIGDGPERPRLEARANELGISNRIKFFPWMERQDLTRHYQSSRVLVVSSLWPEPFGFVGIEAMACGLPVIALNRGGIGEWCVPDTGCELLPGSSATEIASACARLLKDPGLRESRSRQASQAYISRYSSNAQREFLSAQLSKS